MLTRDDVVDLEDGRYWGYGIRQYSQRLPARSQTWRTSAWFTDAEIPNYSIAADVAPWTA
jgi:hypothetical protein